MKECSVKCFSHIHEDELVVLSFILTMWCITLIDFHMSNQPGIPGINVKWSYCIIVLYVSGFDLPVFH